VSSEVRYGVDEAVSVLTYTLQIERLKVTYIFCAFLFIVFIVTVSHLCW
jgi:hypothetical protein